MGSCTGGQSSLAQFFFSFWSLSTNNKCPVNTRALAKCSALYANKRKHKKKKKKEGLESQGAVVDVLWSDTVGVEIVDAR